MAANGSTPIAIEAFSWLGRGAVAAKNYGAAMTYAARTYEIVEEQLKTRKLDDEPRLPIALGAAIEVTALATAGQGGRSDAVLYLRRELDTYKGTSIVERLNKNVNLLSLEGTPALPFDSPKWIGAAPPSLASLRGKPVIVYLWAHWCPDCKAHGPVLEALLDKYKSTGLTLVAPTKFYGYVARREPAGPDVELPYLTGIRDSVYPWMKTVPVPISEQIFAQYGVSTTPTLVLIDRAGNVSKYNPGQLTTEQLEPLIQKIVAPLGSAR
jgi:thiol-disulfide isomerase/thioredoxin